MDMPPTTNYDGKPRRIGVEIEFAAIEVADAAKVVHKHFGGTLDHVEPYRAKVRDTDVGTFTIELDTQFVHANADDPSPQTDMDELIHNAKKFMRQFIGDVSKGFVPCEVVTPPLTYDKLPEMDRLMEDLRSMGGEGTNASPIYAFGLHLNPEVISLKVESILAHLRAFLLLEDWLREKHRIDVSRKVTPFINAFPRAYATKVLDFNYKPDMNQLIDDYIRHNPTRNRDLDMLCLFKFIDRERVEKKLKNTLINPRPTFHYRLPDCRLDDENWNISQELELWNEVEKLAHNDDRLNELMWAFRKHFEKVIPKQKWAEHITKELGY